MSQKDLETLNALLRKQDPTFASAVSGMTRQDLGITSLDVILMVVNYIGDRPVTMRPEWVAHLEDVDGICAVLHEIDDTAKDLGVPA